MPTTVLASDDFERPGTTRPASGSWLRGPDSQYAYAISLSGDGHTANAVGSGVRGVVAGGQWKLATYPDAVDVWLAVGAPHGGGVVAGAEALTLVVRSDATATGRYKLRAFDGGRLDLLRAGVELAPSFLVDTPELVPGDELALRFAPDETGARLEAWINRRLVGRWLDPDPLPGLAVGLAIGDGWNVEAWSVGLLELGAPDWIGSVRLDGAEVDLDRVLASVTIRHGRDAVDGPIQASTASLGLRAIPRAELRSWETGAVLEVEDTNGELLFTGRITDNAIGDDSPLADAVLTVVAVSTLEAAGRRQVRGHQWPAETWGARAARILAEGDLVGIVQAPAPDVPLAQTPPDEPNASDPSTGTWAATDALSALTEILADVDGSAFELGDGSIVVQALAARGELYPLLPLDPAIVLYSPAWEQTLDVRNRIVLGYGYGAGSVTVDDPSSQARYDLRWTGDFETGLADRPTADGQALTKLNRSAWPRWSLSAVTLLEPQPLAVGQLVQLTELPDSAPFGEWLAVVEGWVDSIEGPDWTQDLILSDPQDSGLSAPWADLPPALTWAELDPACRWSDAYNLDNLVPGG